MALLERGRRQQSQKALGLLCARAVGPLPLQRPQRRQRLQPQALLAHVALGLPELLRWQLQLQRQE